MTLKNPTDMAPCKQWLLGICPLGEACPLPHVLLPEHLCATSEKDLSFQLRHANRPNRPPHCHRFFAAQDCEARTCKGLHLFRKKELAPSVRAALFPFEESEDEEEGSSDCACQSEKAELGSDATAISTPVNSQIFTKILGELVTSFYEKIARLESNLEEERTRRITERRTSDRQISQLQLEAQLRELRHEKEMDAVKHKLKLTKADAQAKAD